MPDIVPELQDDIRQALAESDGDFSSSALQNMKKLDSFLKETMRYYPLAAGEQQFPLRVSDDTDQGQASFTRKVLKPFQLSTGEYIPKGVIIEVPAASISSDDGVFEDADKFDALRFYKLRQLKKEQTSGVKAAETVANSQFVSVSESSLTFGYGRHACPGRFFAANEIKMILANLLLHYEIRNPDGVTERHKNIRMGAQVSSSGCPFCHVCFADFVVAGSGLQEEDHGAEVGPGEGIVPTRVWVEEARLTRNSREESIPRSGPVGSTVVKVNHMPLEGIHVHDGNAMQVTSDDVV